MFTAFPSAIDHRPERRLAPPADSTDRARWLDVLAGAELQLGHHAAGERLALMAAATRERVQ